MRYTFSALNHVNGEMLALLFRDRMNLKAPIYFSTGLTEKVLSINEKCP